MTLSQQQSIFSRFKDFNNLHGFFLHLTKNAQLGTKNQIKI